MTSDELQQHYFRQARSCFFRWEDHGQVLAWDNGLTIVFRQEVAAVMKHLAPSCLPPLNAIAVLLSSCRNNWRQSRWYLSLLGGESAEFGLEARGWNKETALWFLRELNRVNSLPLELRADLNARCELAAMIFEDGPKRNGALTPEQSRHLADQMSRGLPTALESQGGFRQTIDEQNARQNHAAEATSATQVLPHMMAYVDRDARTLMQDLQWLQPGLRNVSAEALRRRIRTGLENEIQPADQHESQKSRSLIEELLQDEDLGGLARLARDLMALLTFPRQLSQPEELSLGGISDITNRGQLDRLLLSELAHDDLTLATRIALNEALYVHRESPPAVRPRYRRVLIDTGLCMWGVPRLFAASVGLSMAANADANVKLDFVRFDGEQLQSVAFTAREGVLQHLEVLTAALQPAAALPSFFESPSHSEAEFVIITHDDVAADADFRRQLIEGLPAAATFLVTLTRDGDLTLTSVNQFGSRIVRKGKLNLTQILAGPKKRRPLHSPDSGLPIILQQKQFPLRMYHQIDSERGFRSDRGVVMCSTDGRLMLWDLPGCGARQLTDKLGKGRLFWCGSDPYGVAMLVFGHRSGSALKLVRIHEDGYIPITPLKFDDTPRRVSGHAGRIFIQFEDHWEMFRAGRSSCIARREIQALLPPYELSESTAYMSASSRFFDALLDSEKLPAWYALAESDGEITIQEVPLKNPDDVTTLFDRRGHGIVAVHKDGRIERLYGNEQTLKKELPGKIEAIAADGSSFVISNAIRHFSGELVTTDDFQTRFVRHSAEAVIGKLHTSCAPHSLRNQFPAIAVSQNQLYLRTKKGPMLAISRKSGIHMEISPTIRGFHDVLFEAMTSPDGCEYTLHVARWPCGSRVYLDSRGLLHLASWNAEVPQITLVLHEGRMSGWCESGGAFGIAYSMPDGRDTSVHNDELIYSEAIEGFVRCIRQN